MNYQKIIIYYFSGTGNSKNVAKWMLTTANRHNIEGEIISIAKTDVKTLTPPQPNSLIVFVSPIHGFNYPPIMLNYLIHFPKGNSNVVLMNTRAGMLIGNFITPGLTGIAFYVASLILLCKGYTLKGMFPVDMPSNWISIHPALNERTVSYLHSKNKERVFAFAEKIIRGKYCFKAFYDIIQDLAIAPISILYYIVGRFAITKTYYASSDCNRCGACIKNCPLHAIKYIHNRPFWTLKCENCMQCMCNCPKVAIETAHGAFAIFYLLFYLVFIGSFYAGFSFFFFELKNELLKFAIEVSLFILLLTVWYQLIHYLLRFKFIERLIEYTSLTRLKFWRRRYKALND